MILLAFKLKIVIVCFTLLFASLVIINHYCKTEWSEPKLLDTAILVFIWWLFMAGAALLILLVIMSFSATFDYFF